MIQDYSYIFVSFTVIIIVYFFIHRQRNPPFKRKLGGIEPPQSKSYLPFNIDGFITYAKKNDSGKLLDYWRDVMQKTGSDTVKLDWLGSKAIATLNPENIKYILATQFHNWEKGEWFFEAWHDFLGAGIFNSDGENWKRQRALIRPFFTQEKITNLSIFDKHVKVINEILQRHADSGESIDIQDLWFRFTIDSSTDYLFGKNINSLHDPKVEFAHHFNTVQLIVSHRTRIGKFWPYLMFMTNKQMKTSMKYIQEFIDPIINEALKRKNNHPNRASMTLLDSLCEITDDRIMLRDALLNILLAGRDTTAALLTWIIYNLSKRPDIVNRLIKELDQHIPIPKGQTAHDFFSIDYYQLKECRLLRAVINETLRLYPSVPANLRTSINEDILPTGHYVPPNTTLFYVPYVMQRRHDIWGVDADEFNPDRWNLVDKPPNGVPLSAFVPFNAGPRICLGQQFAFNESLLVLARFLRAWKWEPIEPLENLKPNISVIITIDKTFPVKIFKRE